MTTFHDVNWNSLGWSSWSNPWAGQMHSLIRSLTHTHTQMFRVLTRTQKKTHLLLLKTPHGTVRKEPPFGDGEAGETPCDVWFPFRAVMGLVTPGSCPASGTVPTSTLACSPFFFSLLWVGESLPTETAEEVWVKGHCQPLYACSWHLTISCFFFPPSVAIWRWRK